MPKNTVTRSRRASAPKTHRNTATSKPVAPINKTWKAEYAAKNARVAATLDLADLSDRERAFLATCQKIYRRWTGCNSPFEEFFIDLVHFVEGDEWPTPDDAARELETFKENYDDMRRDSARFLEAYPQQSAQREGTHA